MRAYLSTDKRHKHFPLMSHPLDALIEAKTILSHTEPHDKITYFNYGSRAMGFRFDIRPALLETLPRFIAILTELSESKED